MCEPLLLSVAFQTIQLLQIDAESCAMPCDKMESSFFFTRLFSTCRCDRGHSASSEASCVREKFDRQHVYFDKSTDDYHEWKRGHEHELSEAIRSE